MLKCGTNLASIPDCCLLYISAILIPSISDCNFCHILWAVNFAPRFIFKLLQRFSKDESYLFKLGIGLGIGIGATFLPLAEYLASAPFFPAIDFLLYFAVK